MLERRMSLIDLDKKFISLRDKSSLYDVNEQWINFKKILYDYKNECKLILLAAWTGEKSYSKKRTVKFLLGCKKYKNNLAGEAESEDVDDDFINSDDRIDEELLPSLLQQQQHSHKRRLSQRKKLKSSSFFSSVPLAWKIDEWESVMTSTETLRGEKVNMIKECMIRFDKTNILNSIFNRTELNINPDLAYS